MIGLSRPASVRQGAPDNRNRHSIVPDPNRKYIHRSLAEMPLRTVDHDHVRRGLRKQVQKQASQCCEINIVLRQKPLDAAVIRLLLNTGFQGQGNLPQIRRRQSEQRRGKSRHELEPGPMPPKVIGENVRDRGDVSHNQRGWRVAKIATWWSRSVLPGAGPVHMLRPA